MPLAIVNQALPKGVKLFIGDAVLETGGFGKLQKMPWAGELFRQFYGIQKKVLTVYPTHKIKEFYAREFNFNPSKVICCNIYEDKFAFAAKAVKEGFVPILIDGSSRVRNGWEMEGGIFIHYPHPYHVTAVAGCAQNVKVLAKFAQKFQSLGLMGELRERLWDNCWSDNWYLGKQVGMGERQIEELKEEAENQLRGYEEWKQLRRNPNS